MTYIEFFETYSVENLCACLINSPERVILLGSHSTLMKKHIRRYQKIFRARGKEIEFICHSVNGNNLSDIIKVLEQLMEQYDDIAFGLTGGDDLFLVAMGIVFERYPNKKIQMHRINICNDVIIDCDMDGKALVQKELPMLSLRENIMAYGGDLTNQNFLEDWYLDEDFKNDIRAMWDICRMNPRKWNAQIVNLGMAKELAGETVTSLKTEISTVMLKSKLQDLQLHCRLDPEFFHVLQSAGLLSTFTWDDHHLSVTYKNKQVKRCLTKAGQALEMKVYLETLLVTEQNGTPVYHDVRNGVCIDWDGKNEAFDTVNEVDVMMMHHMIPVFVSCKNGRVEIEELYKLNTVAERFGGRYARKVLVASSLETDSNYVKYLRQRAADMQIMVIEDIVSMTDAELHHILRSLWKDGMK